MNFHFFFFLTKGNNILTHKSLCIVQLAIFVYNVSQLLFGYTELAHSMMFVSTRREMLQEFIFQIPRKD